MDGRPFEAVARLAKVGLVLMEVASVAALLGLPVLAWWIWKHLEIGWH